MKIMIINVINNENNNEINNNEIKWYNNEI